MSISSNNINGSVSASGASGDGSMVSAKSCEAKLPKLLLPTFSGDPVAWATFWESFSSAIHQNADLSDLEKFQYLQSLLQKSAADTICGLPLTGVNYKKLVICFNQYTQISKSLCLAIWKPYSSYPRILIKQNQLPAVFKK